MCVDITNFVFLNTFDIETCFGENICDIEQYLLFKKLFVSAVSANEY